MKFNLKLQAFFFFIVLSLNSVSCKKIDNHQATKSFEAMNTFMILRAYGSNAEKGNEKASEKILELENLISTTNPQSKVYEINHSNGQIVPIDNQLFELMNFSLAKAQLTDGAFNPVLFPVTKAWGFTTDKYQVPSREDIKKLLMHCNYRQVYLWDEEDGKKIQLLPEMAIDLGAVGKGYAGDKAVEVLQENGVKSALLDLGGNIHLLGCKPDGSDFKIGIKNPDGGEVPLALSLNNCAVITSGGYERYFTADDGKKYIHIFDGRTGKPVKNNVISTTIVCKSGLNGDFLSTASFILGKEWTINQWKSGYSDFEFIIMFDDGSICYSNGLAGRITLIQQFTSVEVIQ